MCGYKLGVQAFTFSLISIAPMREKTVSAGISREWSDLNFAFMCTAASLIVFSSQPAKSVNLSPSRRCKSQARLRCWKFVIWLPWVVMRYALSCLKVDVSCWESVICWNIPSFRSCLQILTNSFSILGCVLISGLTCIVCFVYIRDEAVNIVPGVELFYILYRIVYGL